MGLVVDDVQAAIGPHGDSRGKGQRGLGRRPTITPEAATRHRVDDAIGPHAPDEIVHAVGDIQAAIGTHGDSVGIAQESQRRRDAVTSKGIVARTRHRGDDAIGRYASNAPVIGKGDIQAAIGPHGDSGGNAHLRLGRRSAIAGEAIDASSRHRGDDAIGPHASNAQVVMSAIYRLPSSPTATPRGL